MATRFTPKFWKPGTAGPGQGLEEERQTSKEQTAQVVQYNPNQALSIEQQRQKLPVFQHRNHILYLVERYQTVVIIGETGCGKSTQLPQYLLEAGWAGEGYRIAVTQPRRVAAITVANRIAEERGTLLGDEVGYMIRFDDCSDPQTTRILFVTDGMLIREIMKDPLLKRYSIIMVDEAHERSINTDIILGLLRKENAYKSPKEDVYSIDLKPLQIQKKRKDLKLIVASATLDAEEMKNFFNSNDTDDTGNDTATILTVEGREFPVDIHYLLDPCPDYLKTTVETVMKIHFNEREGDILAFLTGQDEVQRVVSLLIDEAKKLSKDDLKMKVLPMHGSLPAAEQMKVFERTSRFVRKIVVATNIAETSITINGIVYIIDCGFVKIKAYNPTSGLESLVIVPVSQASANQRAGRAGRVRAGKAYRLYTESSYETLPESTVPEMQRSDLAPVVLQLKALGISNVLRFHFLSAPPAQNMVRGLELLYALGAIDDNGNLTSPLGLQMAEFPLSPMFAKMLLVSGEYECSEEALTVAAMTQIQNVFVTPSGRKIQMDKARRRFSCEEGDHISLINIYNAFLKYGKNSKWCHEYFLNYKGLCRAVEIREQLKRLITKYKVPLNSSGGHVRETRSDWTQGTVDVVYDACGGRDYRMPENQESFGGGYNSSLTIPLPTSYTRGIMPANRNHIPTPENVTQWTHLASMSSELVQLQDCEVGILIGYNCPKALIPRDVIPSDSDGPYAVRTDLGWSVVGVMDPECVDEDPIGSSHRILTYTVLDELSPKCDATEKPSVMISLQTSVRETIGPSQVIKVLEQDFVEHEKSDKVMSYDDAKFMKIAKTSIRQGADKHYEMPLPFRQPEPKLPNNKIQATRRLEQLTRRLQRDNKFHADYVAFMDKIIQNGYAERAPATDGSEKTVWYIPHHGVYHPRKPNKIRVVFDCSARFRGESLNDQLLQGPDMTNTLIGVLHRFRQERIAVMCDIEQMFYQFWVNKDQRDYLRFLWFEKGDFNSDPIEYRMNVHLFGATSSPGCSNYCLRQCADDYEEEVGHEAAEFLRNHFYVDDGLKSVPTVREAVELVSASQELCAKGGIRLHKFVSNSKEIMKSLPSADCVNPKETELLKGMDFVEKPLGILWCVESDTLSIRVTLQNLPLTRRDVLSTVSSVYDPLGFIAPVIMVGKAILQAMCRDNADWDDPVPDTLRPQWERWRTEILELRSLSVDRCFKPQEFGKVERVEFHHFSDASNLGYGQCSYVRLIDSDERVHVSFLMGKSRVAPLKQVTIPRLELTAALVSVRVSTLLSRELEYEDVKHVYWTDSKVVIGYINNDSKRFHVFVANRVSQIREKTEPTQWRYVETKNNPADDASRGLTPHNLTHKSDWLKGPLFLLARHLPEQHTDSGSMKLDNDDPEVKCVKGTVMKIMATESTKPDMVERFARFSDWFRLKRAVAMCLKLVRKLRQDVKLKHSEISESDKFIGPCTKVTVNDMTEAEKVIVRCCQQTAYGEEIKLLQSLKDNPNRELKKTSALARLDPFLDDSGVLRVGGRIRMSSVTCNEKHPVILPKGHHVSKLVIRQCHEKTCHQGRGMTINEVRATGYWIVGCNSAVSSYIYKCVKCRKLRSQVQQQRMADLPSERVNESPPFTYCGVDCFGPFLVKEGRKMLKRYGVLFTCLACHAIHVEVASSLSTDSFINALRRFQAVRGPVRELRCDRGTNFVGAMNELKDCFESEMSKDYLLKCNCDLIEFNMNVPGASHMGGVWERQIRSVRSVLNSLMDQASGQLNDESLRTLMSEATVIVNSRPLSTDSLSDPTSLEPLTANHLLTMKTQILLPPPGHFQKADVYACKQWRRVQYYANEFWSRWKKEFLQNMQTRQRWTRHSREVRIGDVMIVKNDNVPRNQWQLGRVVETFPSHDGHVRKVKLQIGDPGLDPKGRRRSSTSFLERPVQKLVLLLEHEQ